MTGVYPPNYLSNN